MKDTAIRSKAAKRDSTRFIDRYLNEIINYGGLPVTRAAAVLDMQRIGSTQGEIDRWLQGYELARRLREERMHLITPKDRSPKASNS